MTARSETHFDETLLTGYLDGELTQADRQRVRVELENSAELRSLLADLREMREASVTTRWAVPTDEQWDERPRGPASKLFRSVGWLLVAAWVAAVAIFAVWGWWSSPGTWREKALVALLVVGPLCLFLSVLIDRLKNYKNDRYRRVEK